MTQVELCNIALAHLGEARITAVTDDTAKARACALHFAATRDEVLRSHRWNFAVRRAVLTEAAPPPFGWSRAFTLPVDCLRVLEVNESEAGDWITQPWAIEGQLLLTDAATANLVYIRRLADDEELKDPLFAQALGLKLAVALAETIRGATGKSADLLATYERITAPLARRVDANEGRRRKGMLPLNSLFVRTRQSGITLGPYRP